MTAFRTLAQHALESLRKGERVIVSGRLRVRRWEAGEKTGIAVEIDADSLGHDLRWGVSRFEKRVGGAADPQASTAATEPAAVAGPGAETAAGSSFGAGPGAFASSPRTGALDSESAAEVLARRTSNGEPSADGMVPLLAA